MFNYQPEKVPSVEFDQEWELSSGEINQIFKTNGWSFELSEDGDPADAERAAYAWIAWHDFLLARKSLKNG
jgi:hypothetical protein